jgi:hypothetical protein
MTAATLSKPDVAALPPDQWDISLILRGSEGGPELTREPVVDADLLDAQGELWLDGCLRKGHPEMKFEELTWSLAPRFVDASQRSDGFSLQALTPAGTTIQRDFPLEAFADVAGRARQRLIDAKLIRLEDPYFYEVTAHPKLRTGTAAEGPAFAVTTHSSTLQVLRTPLAPLLSGSQVVGSVEGVFPVLYTQPAFARMEQFARRGASVQPPIETGAVLVGPLCSCRETGDFFVVVSDVFEVTEAEEGQFSLSYTGKSWTRIQAIVRAMQSQPGKSAYRLLGQAHGHPFPPAGGAPPCAACSQVKVCGRTSVFASLDDRLWSQCVFSKQPWQLCHIFGSNARRENVHALYTLRANRLLERGFYLIPDFQPSVDSARDSK